MHIDSRGIIRITLLACALDTAHLSGSDVRPQKVLAARGETPAAFGRRCIPPPPQRGCRVGGPGAGCVAPRSNTPGIAPHRAQDARWGPRPTLVAPFCRGPHGADCAPWGGGGRIAALGATLDFHHGLPEPAHSKFELSVDSIMRGPKRVGYPPTGLRWSGDSSRLYFEWRQPGDEEPATWVVGRDGGALRKLSDAERRHAPPVSGAWDHSHRRVLFVDQGDIVLLDS